MTEKASTTSRLDRLLKEVTEISSIDTHELTPDEVLLYLTSLHEEINK